MLADEAYLMVDPTADELAWMEEIRQRGLHRFVPDGPAREIGPGIWKRSGTIDGNSWEVLVDTTRGRGHVQRVQSGIGRLSTR